jgi:hypothetical protein
MLGGIESALSFNIIILPVKRVAGQRTGRVRLRPNRGHPASPGLTKTYLPMELAGQLTKEFRWGRVARQVDTGSPGSDGASPYLPALPPRRRVYNIIPYGIGQPN